MPTDFQLTPQALSDLDEIWNHIAKDSMSAANRVESAILTACTNLAKNPLLGAKRIEISALPVRFWTVSRFPNFMAVYRPETKPLQIVSLLHGTRIIKTVIGDKDHFDLV
jgi:plasmid stabilization system protein ParE